MEWVLQPPKLSSALVVQDQQSRDQHHNNHNRHNQIDHRNAHEGTNFPTLCFTFEQHNIALTSALSKVTILLQRKMRESYDDAARLIAASVKKKLDDLLEKEHTMLVRRNREEVVQQRKRNKASELREQRILLDQIRQEIDRGKVMRQKLEQEYVGVGEILKDRIDRTRLKVAISQDVQASHKELVTRKQRLEKVLQKLDEKMQQNDRVGRHMNDHVSADVLNTYQVVGDWLRTTENSCFDTLLSINRQIEQTDNLIVDCNISQTIDLLDHAQVTVDEAALDNTLLEASESLETILFPNVATRQVKLRPPQLDDLNHGDEPTFFLPKVLGGKEKGALPPKTPKDLHRGARSIMKASLSNANNKSMAMSIFENEQFQTARRQRKKKLFATEDDKDLLQSSISSNSTKGRDVLEKSQNSAMNSSTAVRVVFDDDDDNDDLEARRTSFSNLGSQHTLTRRKSEMDDPNFVVLKPMIQCMSERPIYALEQQQEEVAALQYQLGELRTALADVQLFITNRHLAEARRIKPKQKRLAAFRQREESIWNIHTLTKLKAAEIVRDVQDVFLQLEAKHKTFAFDVENRKLRVQDRDATLEKDMEKTRSDVERYVQRTKSSWESLEDMLYEYLEWRVTIGESDKDSLSTGGRGGMFSLSSLGTITMLRKNMRKPKFMDLIDVGVQINLDEEDLPKDMRKLFLISNREEAFKCHIESIRSAIEEISNAQSRLDVLMRCQQCTKMYHSCFVLFPCGHTFCGNCIHATTVGAATHKCPVCRLITQDRFVPNCSVNSIAGKFVFMASGFNDLNGALEHFAVAWGSLDRKVLVSEVKMLSEEVLERTSTGVVTIV